MSNQGRITYGNQAIIFELIRSKRKTMEISILPPGIVRVKAPASLSEQRILQAVQAKGAWISTKLGVVAHRIAIDRQFVSGEKVFFLGNEYILDISYDPHKQPSVSLDQDKIMVETPSIDLIKTNLEVWYRARALEKISARVEYFQKAVGKKPVEIKVKEQKKRWGSCTSAGKLLFNWRCIMAPSQVLDYVIVHELCHLVHMNHSADYWKLVQKILPEYLSHKKWLKDNGWTLQL